MELKELWARWAPQGKAPKTWEETLAAACCGRLWSVDTASSGFDCLWAVEPGEGGDEAVVAVAEHAANGDLGEAESLSEWAARRGWTASSVRPDAE
jgi:hypothetical protein